MLENEGAADSATETTTGAGTATETTEATTEATEVVTDSGKPDNTEADAATGDEGADGDDSEAGDETEGDAEGEASRVAALAEFREVLNAERELAQADATVEAEETVKDTTATAEAPKPLGERWVALKAELEEDWKTYVAPGEKRLADFIESLIPDLEGALPKVSAIHQEMEAAAMHHEAQIYVTNAQAAAAAINKDLGLDIDFSDVLNAVRLGGLHAYATLNGKAVDDYRGRIPADVMREIFEIKHRGRIAKLGSTPKPTTEKKTAPRSLSTGGGARERSTPLTPLEEIRADREAARAAAKGR